MGVRRKARKHGVGARAGHELRYIRETMASATTFTAVPGQATMVIGLTALAAAAAAAQAPSPESWLAIWLAEAVLACLVGILGIWLKARRTWAPLAARPGKRFLTGYLAPMAAGVVLTAVMAPAGHIGLLGGLWLLLYGTAGVAGGVSSIKPVRFAGAGFMLLGCVALWSPHLTDVLMALGFGGIHIVFGWVIARRYGG